MFTGLLNVCEHGVFFGQCDACVQKIADEIREGLLYRRVR